MYNSEVRVFPVLLPDVYVICLVWKLSKNPYFQLFWNIQHTIVCVHRAKSLFLLSYYSLVPNGPLSSLYPVPPALRSLVSTILIYVSMRLLTLDTIGMRSFCISLFASGLFHIIFCLFPHIVTNNNIYFYGWRIFHYI